MQELSSLKYYAMRVAAFLLPLVVLAAGLEAGTRRVGTLHEVRARTLQAPNEAELLVTGNSHETVGIICRELGRPCFKLAAGSQSVFYDRALLRRFGHNFPKVRAVLIGISFYSFKYAMESDEGWRQYEYWHAYGIDGEREPLPFSDARRYSRVMTAGTRTVLGWAAAGFPRALPAAAADARGDVDVGAFVQRDKSRAALERRIAQHHRRLRPELVAEARAAVDAMVDWAKQRGALPVMVVTPVSPGYAERIEPGELAFVHGELARQQGRGAIVADYLADSRFADDLFYDFDHLNARGAQLFTELLRVEVLQPALGKLAEGTSNHVFETAARRVE